jgi:c-di-GMP-binding flagellar brake protein YcgR
MGTEFEEARKQLESLIGSKVELVITSGLYKGSFPSKLEELDGGFIGVSHPMYKGAFLPALRSTELLMKIEGAGCIYQAVTSAMRSSLKLNIPMLWLKLESPLEKVQRRMFVRVPSSIKADVFFLGVTEELLEDVVLPPREWFSARISDISLGGIGISIKENLTSYYLEGGRYLFSMKIANNAFFVVGKLVKILSKRESGFEMGFAYESLSVFIEKIMGGYIRQQELTMRG